MINLSQNSSPCSPAVTVVRSKQDQLAAHRKLAEFNQNRISPRFPSSSWRDELSSELENLLLEGDILEWERHAVKEKAALAPSESESFMKWFEELKVSGPGQNDPLFDWLATTASKDQMKWFIQQEVAGEAGFDDLTALTQLKLPVQAKLEVARNYWDEMGRGHEKGMHGPMLGKVAQELGLSEANSESAHGREVVPEALALGNILLGLAMNRRYAYHSVGALGAVELTAPARAKKVYEGLKRLGISPEGQRYYLIHSTLDINHSIAWNKEVIFPLVSENPKLIPFIAEGALMRLNAGSQCYVRYRKEFGLRDSNHLH